MPRERVRVMVSLDPDVRALAEDLAAGCKLPLSRFIDQLVLAEAERERLRLVERGRAVDGAGK